MDTLATPWEPPSFDTTKEPIHLGLVQLDSCCRAAKWCSDGNSILTMSEDRCLDVYDASSVYWDSETQNHGVKDMSRRIGQFRQGSPIYDTIWYPFASPSNPASFCFLASLREAPVKLLDASDGRLRASYKIVDHRERFVAPHSMAFNSTAQRFYCGYLDAIEIFDLNLPGEGTRLLTRPTKKSKDGVRGIISAIDFCPDYSGLFAAGTFTSSIGIFSEDTGSQVLRYLDDIPGPISQLQFHPTNPNLLFCSCRNVDGIYIWDVRSVTTLHSSLNLTSASNQRRRFDIDAGGRWLVAGDEEGRVNYYDLNRLDDPNPTFNFQAHTDAVSTAAFHPAQSVLMTVSGSRRFETSQDVNSEEEASSTSADEGDSSTDESMGEARREVIVPRAKVMIAESTMKLWKA